ncbi:MAG: PAAR domain-containing protein [Rhizobiaceae bacterium]
MRLPASILLMLVCATPVHAQTAPSQIITGSQSVTVDGKQAATSGDVTSSGNVVTEGSTNVFINGKPAALAGSSTNCGGAIITGSSTVFVNGKPLASSGDQVANCPSN